MKQVLKINVLIILLLILFSAAVYAQRTNNVPPAKDTSTAAKEKQSLLEQILKALVTDSTIPSRPQVPTEKNARISYEFIQQRIYPSEDALELIHILNPWLDTVSNTIPPNQDFKMPVFTWIKKGQREKLKQDLALFSVPDMQTSAVFKNEVSRYNNGLESFVQKYKEFASVNINLDNSFDMQPFLDTLEFFSNKLLPVLAERGINIFKGKMDYFNSNLSQLTDNMEYMQTDTDFMNTEQLAALAEIINDFIYTSGFSYQNNSINLERINKQFTVYNAVYKAGNNKPVKNEDNGIAVINGSNNEVNCRIHIYNQNGEPIEGRFFACIAPYITRFSKKDCATSDIYECFKDWSGGAGAPDEDNTCTAAVAMANNANWVIYLKDTHNNKSYAVDKRYNLQNITDTEKVNNKTFLRILLIYKGE